MIFKLIRRKTNERNSVYNAYITKRCSVKMDFLGLLRALDLEPVSNSATIKMIDSVMLQGHLIHVSELGEELSVALVRLITEDKNVGEAGEEVSVVELFRDVKLPEINQTTYVQRRLEHNVVLLTKGGSSWKSLEQELSNRIQSDDRVKEGKCGQEIFAVSWSGSSDGGSGGSEAGEEDDVELFEKAGSSSPESEIMKIDNNDYKVLKASELINWIDSTDRRYSTEGDDETEVYNSEGVRNEIMEVDDEDSDDEYKKKKREQIIRNFLNPQMTPYHESANVRLVELDNFETPDEQFKNLHLKAKHFTVHWLQAFPGGGFIWRKSYGSLKFSRLNLSPICYQEEKWFPYLEHKAWQNIICISGVSGMGKTTFLAHMAHELKRKYKNRLICFIDLKKLSDMLDMMKEEKLNMINFSTLFSKYLNLDKDHNRNDSNMFKTAIFAMEGNGMEPKVELLMDGLDRMSSKGRQLLVECLQEERSVCEYDNWSFRVWLTTRPHLKYEIEEAFSIVSYDLDALNSCDMIGYFVMRDDYTHCDHTKEIYAVSHSLFSPSLKTYLKMDVGGLLAEPEKMRAFAVFMRLNEYPSPFKLNATLIMKQIIMRNIKNYYVVKYLEHDPTLSKKDKVGLVETILRKHIPMAIRVCSGESGKPTEAIELTEDESSGSKDLLEFGLMTTNKEGKFYFIHPAYPAYILAEHYLHSSPDNSIKSDFFLNYVLVKDACELIRQFYDESLGPGIKEDICSTWVPLLRNFLINTYFLSNDEFDHNVVQATTTVFHLAIIDRRLRLAKLLLWSFSPEHRIECKRLIKRKVLVQISDICKSNYKTTYARKEKNKTSDKNSTKITTNQITNCLGHHHNKQQQQHVELSSLSLAILFGDEELVSSMYKILGNEGEAHIQSFSPADDFHYTPLHLSVIGCNPISFNYLCSQRKMSPNKPDKNGHFPLHLVFYNRWILKFPSIGRGNQEIESDSDTIREVHICKYYEDTLDPEWNERVGQLPDRAGHLPLLSSRFVQIYMRRQMKLAENFHHKRISQPKKMCYYKSYKSYLDMTKRLSGRTLVNFERKVKDLVSPPFHYACSEGYLPMIKAMLEKNVNLNIKDKRNRTALCVALCKQNMHVVQYLLEQGINRDVLSQRINELPLLHHVAVQNLPQAVAYLVQELKVPVDQPATESDNCTALHLACFAGCQATVEKLIELGADVNCKDDEDYTALLHATHPDASHDLKLIRYLISKGANVTAVCDGGKTCLHLAIMAGNEKDTRLPLIQLLLAQAKELLVNTVTVRGQSPLHLACKNDGNIGILKVLVEHGAKLDLQDNQGRSPLFIFCKYNMNDTAMGLYLINQRVNIFQVNKVGQNPLNLLSTRNASLVKLMYSAWKANIVDSIKGRVEGAEG